MKCINCNTDLIGTQTKFCNKKCKDNYYHKRDLVDVKCTCCGSMFKRRRQRLGIYRSLCRHCSSRQNALDYMAYKSGKDSPKWRGGYKYWMSGRYGKDKDGLSWKIQRRLARERDGYLCQKCGCCEINKKVSVHHKVPYRISFSHALDNLICLCKRCHPRDESQIKELWGGKTLAPPMRGLPKPRCSICSKKRKLIGGICTTCIRIKNITTARLLLNEGLSYVEVGRMLNKDRRVVWSWVNICKDGVVQ